MKKRMNWDKMLDLLMLVIFSVLAICLLVVMSIRGLSIFEFSMMLIFAVLADGSLNNVIEE